MKTVLDKITRDELIRRIGSLNENSTSQWGKMTLRQMLKHCALWNDMVFGDRKMKRELLGYVFGRLALKHSLKDESPIGRGAPAGELKVNEAVTGSLESLKAEWIERIEQYEYFSKNEFMHPFFGTMTKEQIGQFAYKHNDHHLRQFNS